MTTTTTNVPNGRVSRKTLSDQIDRLDGILDGLSDGLNDAVVSAVREAVGVAVHEAVRTVLSEVMCNPEVLAKLRAHVAPPAPVAATMPAPQTESRVSRRWAWITARLRAMCHYCAAAFDRLRGGVAAARQRLDTIRVYAQPLLIATGVGVLVGVLAYLAGPSLAALASGVVGFATSLAVQAGLWFRRTVGALPRWDT